MTVEHANVTTFHEPKGAAAAVQHTVLTSDGAGNTNWALIGTDSLTGINNINQEILTFRLEDISTAGSHWLVTPFAGDVAAIYSVIDGAIATGDATLSFEINGTPITGGDITVTQSGSAAGDVDSTIPSAANTLTAGQALEIITDGASTNTVNATLTFVIDVS